MSKVKVLIVDDSVVVRKILTDTISADPTLEVVGAAANGKIALQKIPLVNPDIIVLDVEMPVMDGIETIKHVRKDYAKLPIVMFSTLTEKGAVATMDALSAGASDYVTKPTTNSSDTNASKEAVKASLIAKIKLLTQKQTKSNVVSPISEISSKTILSNTKKTDNFLEPINDISAIVIGVSTGGPNALAELMPEISPNIGVPILIVQHMPKMFTKLLAERLDTKCSLSVVEAVADQEIKAGTVYIAPGDFHLELKRQDGKVFTHLHQGPQENSCRPAVDVLFRSAAKVFGCNLLGVILTGMGKDGFLGSTDIKNAGGHIIAQDKESSVVWGMPSYVANGNLADAVLPLNQIASRINLFSSAKGKTSFSQKESISRGA